MLKKIIILAFLFILCVLTGCSSNNGTKSGGYSAVDALGNVVHMSKKPVNIVSLTYGTDEIIFSLVEAKRIKAFSKWADHKELCFLTEKELSTVKNRVEIASEAIVKEQPDLVLASTSTDAAIIQTLKDMNIPVYVSYSAKNVQEMENKITGIAAVVGEEAKGKLLIKDMKTRLNSLENKLSKLQKANEKVCIVYAFTRAIGRKDGMLDTMLKAAHLRNGAAEAGLDKGNVLSKEQIVSENPDIIFLPNWNFGHKDVDVDSYKKEFMSDHSFDNIKAVKNNQIYILPERFRYASSHHIVDAIETMAKMAYPELF